MKSYQQIIKAALGISCKDILVPHGIYDPAYTNDTIKDWIHNIEDFIEDSLLDDLNKLNIIERKKPKEEYLARLQEKIGSTVTSMKNSTNVGKEASERAEINRWRNLTVDQVNNTPDKTIERIIKETTDSGNLTIDDVRQYFRLKALGDAPGTPEDRVVAMNVFGKSTLIIDVLNKIAEEANISLSPANFSHAHKLAKETEEFNRASIIVLEHILTAVTDVKSALYPRDKAK